MEITVLNNQSLFDISLVVSGSAEGAFTLAFKNGLSVTDELESGHVLQYDTVNVISKKVVEYYRTNNICPATALAANQGVTPGKHKIFDYTFDYTFE